MNETRDLHEQVREQGERKRRAEREHDTLLSQTIYIGTLGLTMVLPIVGGAYLGRWLDGMSDGYSMRWTLSLLLLGVVLGAVNVYLLIRE